METYPGSWRLFNVLAVHLYRPLQTLIDISYADNLKFIKNKPYKDSLKTLVKLDTKLDTKLDYKEINQMVHSRAF